MKYNTEELKKLGSHVRGLREMFINDRAHVEQQWLRNLRQYKRMYDPDVKARIPNDRSKSYPGDTRTKVKGGVAKMMEMLFPGGDKNWSVEISPNPSIPKQALQNIIDVLQQGEEVSSDDIEREVRGFAKKRAELMEREIDDQLQDPGFDLPQLAKKVIRSGFMYGIGIARAPMVRTQEERFWEFNEQTGLYDAVKKKIRRPYAEWVRVWDGYPDLSAKTWEEQEGFFERFILTRHDLRQLADRPDFIKEAIKGYIRDNATGNYRPKTFETELHEIAKTSNLADRTARRYEVYRFFGFVSAHVLASVGIAVKDDDLDQDILADIWTIDGEVIKAEKAAFGTKVSDQYHAFIYSEDEDSGLTGVGLPEDVRDSQMGVCAASRALMDNMAATAGPILEVNQELLASGRKSIGAIHAFKVIYREGDGQDSQYPAVRSIETRSHIPELLQIIEQQRQQLDIDSNIPAYTLGAMQQQPLGEAFRTTNNMSMMVGAANMVTKDTVRAFDKFTSSLIGAVLLWNMEFNAREEIKGDFQVKARGVSSLVAKEVRGAALDQFVTTLTAEERAILDVYGLLIDRLKSRDLPTDRVLPRDEAMSVIEGIRNASSQATQIEQGLTQARTESTMAEAQRKQVDATLMATQADAVIEEILSRVEKNIADAQSSEDRTQLENLRTILSTATNPLGAIR